MGIRRYKGWLQDAGVAAFLLFMGLMGTRPAGEDQLEWSREPDAAALVLVVLAALPFVFRRRRPVAVLVSSGLAVAVYLALSYPFGPIMLTIPVAAYTVGVQLPHRRALRWVGGYYGVIFVIVAARMFDESGANLWRQIVGWGIASLAAFAAPLAIGAALRVRRLSEADVRSAQARRAVSEERLRMAQELHDSVGHGLAVIAMQAGVALHVLDRNPAKARESLEAIRDASKESLNGLRAELQVLRMPADEVAPRRPSAGLAEADVLLERIRAGGVEVDARLAGRGDGDDGSTLPPDVDVAAYRILQEALTNVLRHSGATRVQVRVLRDGDGLVVDVVDNGSGNAADDPADAEKPAGGGTGIPGMRARAEALGGSLDAGPRPDGGFAVRARLPLREPSMPGSAS